MLFVQSTGNSQSAYPWLLLLLLITIVICYHCISLLFLLLSPWMPMWNRGKVILPITVSTAVMRELKRFGLEEPMGTFWWLNHLLCSCLLLFIDIKITLNLYCHTFITIYKWSQGESDGLFFSAVQCTRSPWILSHGIGEQICGRLDSWNRNPWCRQRSPVVDSQTHMARVSQVNMARLPTGYGSIPIHTIFRGMNIHKSQLFWCEQKGDRVLTHCQLKNRFSRKHVPPFKHWLLRIVQDGVPFPSLMRRVAKWQEANGSRKRNWAASPALCMVWFNHPKMAMDQYL